MNPNRRSTSNDLRDTFLMPLHVADPGYLSFENLVLPLATERGMGIQGMKALPTCPSCRAWKYSKTLRRTGRPSYGRPKRRLSCGSS